MNFIIISLIISVTYGFMIDLDNSENDELCSNNGFKCDHRAFQPCCDSDYKCTRIGNRAASQTFKCLKSAELYESCYQHMDCHNIDHSECNNGECKCLDNFTAVSEDKCGPLLNGFCLEDYDCVPDNSECIAYKCACKSEFFSLSNTQCIPSVLGKPCKIDNNCAEVRHAKCSKEKICVCRDNNIAIKNAICVPLLDAFCWMNERCGTRNSICYDNTCKCEPGYVPSVDECISETLATYCHSNQDCAIIYESKCSQGVCVCRNNKVALNESSCVSLIGDFCHNNGDCWLNDSSCINNECKCNKNFVALKKSECLALILGKLCENDDDCKEVNNSKCYKNGKCFCKEGYLAIGNSYCEKA